MIQLSKNKGMSKEMYDFIISIKDDVSYDLDNGIITTPKGTNGTICSTTGYLKFKKNKKVLQVHQFLAVMYFGEACINMQVNHINGDKIDNRKSNLEVISQLDNIKHQWESGLSNPEKSKKTNQDRYGLKVDQLDMDGNYIRSFNSINEAHRYIGKGCLANIFRMCKGLGQSNGKAINSVGGYKWRFSEK
jgi:hypothetical protein